MEEDLVDLRDENGPGKESSSGRRSRLAKKRSGLANESKQLATLEAERTRLLERVASLSSQLDELRARNELPSIEQLCGAASNGGGDEGEEAQRTGRRASQPASYKRSASRRPLYLLSDVHREPAASPQVLRLRSDPALLECDAERVDWLRISAELFDGRLSDLECRLFWTNALHPRINREPWTDAEQQSLAALVERHEGRFWSLIADELATGTLYIVSV